MPNGKAIIILRDPRSILASFKNITHGPKPIYLQAVFNCYDLFSYIEKLEKEIKSKKIYLLKYEDVVVNKKKQINGVFDFLELPPLKKIELKDNLYDAYGKIWNSNSSFEKNNKNRIFDVKKAINRWRDNLTNEEILFTEFVCGRYMFKYGYDCKF